MVSKKMENKVKDKVFSLECDHNVPLPEKNKKKEIKLSILGYANLIGIIDFLFNPFYRSTVTCFTNSGELYRISKKNFNKYLNMTGGEKMRLFKK